MAWAILITAGILEAVWASALGASDNFHEVVPTILFVIALIASTVGLSYALKSISVGTAYAVWTAIGAALTVIYSSVWGGEHMSVLKAFFLAGIIVCVVGLKVTGAQTTPSENNDGS